MGQVFCTRDCWETFKKGASHEHSQGGGGEPPPPQSDGHPPTHFGGLLQEALKADAGKGA